MLPSIFGENLFDDFFTDPFGMMVMPQRHDPLYGKHSKNLMKTDVREMDGSYELDVDLPGFKKDDISVSLNNGYLTVSAHKDEDSGDKDESGKWLRRERYVGTCSRSFYVGDQVKENDIHANYQNGTLRIQVPKIEAQPQVESKHQIAIEG